MSFGLISLFSSSLLLSPHLPICYIPLFSNFHLNPGFYHWWLHFIFYSLGWWFFTYWCIEGSRTTPFISSFDIDLEILAWEFLMGWGFMCSSVIWERLFIPCRLLLEYDLLMTRVCTYTQKKSAVICLYLISYSIEHVLLFEGCLLGLSLRVCASFPWGLFHSLSHFHYAVWGMRVFREIFLSFVRSIVSWIRVVVLYRYESWVIFH